jgi:quercetin dioxygenase-like cupin family protein
MRTWACMGLVVLALAGIASAQDAVKTVPDSYRHQFENEWVRIVRVHYPPHAKLPAHTHTDLACAYVYLNDSGPVIFKHIGAEYGAATRPPTKAGAFRLYRGLEEIHEVENTSPLPSDFLRVEFKTETTEPRSLRGKFFRETYPVGENVERVQFENVQIRATRVVVAAKGRQDQAAGGAEPAIFIALTPAALRVASSGGNTGPAVTLTPGQEYWLPAGERRRMENTGDAPVELIRFDLKTPPRRPAA